MLNQARLEQPGTSFRLGDVLRCLPSAMTLTSVCCPLRALQWRLQDFTTPTRRVSTVFHWNNTHPQHTRYWMHMDGLLAWLEAVQPQPLHPTKLTALLALELEHQQHTRMASIVVDALLAVCTQDGALVGVLNRRALPTVVPQHVSPRSGGEPRHSSCAWTKTQRCDWG